MSIKFFSRPLLTLLAIAVISTGSVFTPVNTAAAQTDKTEKKKSKAPLIRQKIYEKLTEAQDLVKENKFDEAILVLDDIKDSRRLNSTETTQLWNFYAYVYFSQDLYPQAIAAYAKVLEQPELQLGLRTSTLYTLSQLYFLTEDYKQALKHIEEWINISEKPSADAYAILGQAHYKLKQYKQAVPALNKAIKIQKTEGKQVKEVWYLLLRATHYELKDYKSMIAVLSELITHYPKPQYFRDLAGAYSQLGDTKSQLAIMDSMYESGNLSKPTQIRNLANLFLIHEAPYKAAKIVDEAIKNGALEKDEKNYSLLSQAWSQAREDQKSIAPLQAAANLSSKGEPWIKLARAHVNLDQWKEAIQALETGLDKPEVKSPGSAYLLLGMGYYNLKELNKAQRAFEQSAKVSKSKRNQKTARQWAKYIETEKERNAALAIN